MKVGNIVLRVPFSAPRQADGRRAPHASFHERTRNLGWLPFKRKSAPPRQPSPPVTVESLWEYAPTALLGQSPRLQPLQPLATQHRIQTAGKGTPGGDGPVAWGSIVPLQPPQPQVSARRPSLPQAVPLAPAPVFVNEHVGSTKSGNVKQYTLDGEPLFAAYRQPPVQSESSERGAHATLGQGEYNTVLKRRNEASTVCIKRSLDVMATSEIGPQCAKLNELARLLAHPDAAEFKDCFAPEVLKHVGADRKAVYYAPIVNGFSMFSYFTRPEEHRGKVSEHTLMEEAERLKEAMSWLFSKGFVHGDISRKNVMFDVDRHRLVLVDFVDTLEKTRNESSLLYDLRRVDTEIKGNLSSGS